MTRSRTSRSSARDSLARIRADSLGSPIASSSWSVSSPRAAASDQLTQVAYITPQQVQGNAG